MTAARLDLLIEGARILTGTAEYACGRIGVAGDRIALVEDAASTPPPPARQVLDGAGRLATPGFVNVHTHACLTMVRGVAEDMGFAPAYTRGVPNGHHLTPDEAVALARLGALEALKFGSTLINDTYVHAADTLPAMAELGLRVTASPRIHDVDLSRLADGVWEHRTAIGRRTLDEALALHQRFGGTANGRVGVQLAAHAPDSCTTAFLREIRDARDATGLRVTTHLAQSSVEVERVRARDGVSPVELLDGLGLLDDRLIAAHCIWMSDDDIARAGRAGITVAHIPKGNATGGTMAPTSRLRRAGARLALATDNMHADMVEVMRWALNLGRVQEGRADGFWQPADVFVMATAAGADAMGMAGRIGALAVGAKADIVLFDIRQPHWVPMRGGALGKLVHVGQGRDVRHVVVDGVLVVEDGRATRADEDAILADAQRAADAVWERAQG